MLIKTFFVQASTGFHLVYIAASTLIDIKERIRRSKGGNSEERSCFYEPILLFLLHLAAVVVSSTNFFVEQVSVFLSKAEGESISSENLNTDLQIKL